MKIGWGTRVTILYCSFVVMILILVFIAMTQDFHLVTDDYYAKEIQYQQQIDKLNNSALLSEKLIIQYDRKAENISFSFPENPGLKGEILFYRPSDANKDFNLPIQMDEQNRQFITTQKLLKGLWKVKVDWEANGTNYYDEKTIIVQ